MCIRDSKYTMKANTVAVVSDGSAVLGLGNIGPYAAMPVMEGKAVLLQHCVCHSESLFRKAGYHYTNLARFCPNTGL